MGHIVSIPIRKPVLGFFMGQLFKDGLAIPGLNSLKPVHSGHRSPAASAVPSAMKGIDHIHIQRFTHRFPGSLQRSSTAMLFTVEELPG